MKIAFAYFVLVAFVPFALLVLRRMPRAQGSALVVLLGLLFLPDRIAIDLPLVPPMGKEYITYLAVLLGACLFHRDAVVRARPGTGMELVVIALFVANVATAMKNSVPMMDEGVLEDGLGIYWIAATTLDDLLLLSLPYFVGRALFTTTADLYVFLRILVLAATGYTALIVLESLMSIPFRVWQLSEVIYGLPARINMRWGFIQPVVFLHNGLALSTFMAVALIAAAGIAKAGLPLPRIGARFGLPRIGSGMARNVVAVGLLLARNVAGAVYGWSFLVAYLFAHSRTVMLFGVSLAILACVYPALRMADLFPHEAIVEFANEYDPDRARSLEGRFLEEEHVLGKIGDRLALGWGTFGRVPGAETFGRGEAGLDGWVTIRIGTSGVIGLALYYLVFATSVFRGWFRIGRADRTGRILIGALMGMLSIRMIDMIINGWWNCLPVFLAGVLAGVVGNLDRGAAPRVPAPVGSGVQAKSQPGGRRDPRVREPSENPADRSASIASLLQTGSRDDE